MTLFDPGLQPERTELAWRRTALALGAGSLVALRLFPVAFGHPAWAFGGVAGLVAAAALWLAARRRYRAVNGVLEREGDRGMLPGASPIAALAVVALGIGLVSLAVVIVTALRTA
ncbi:DUF202 domain-containing protein [Microbacterium sp. H37-C3]|uniref:DUF202 domain-containing protein n=1 Tax=Microbacterium sp. H37-C3 TaxID=3004354 RepID=UPI0022AFD153|nr:DUF202 domain-containing protein [Microbacterium sp. H37-C3]MCZ4068857.1 DUF202 domain-containing protein [Microbacterium sp. H37-C3]